MNLQELDGISAKLKSNDIIPDNEMKNITASLNNMKQYIEYLKDKINSPEKSDLKLTPVDDTNINDKIKEINELCTIADRSDKPIEEFVDVFIRLSKLNDQCNDYLNKTKKVEPVYL